MNTQQFSIQAILSANKVEEKRSLTTVTEERKIWPCFLPTSMQLHHHDNNNCLRCLPGVYNLPGTYSSVRFEDSATTLLTHRSGFLMRKKRTKVTDVCKMDLTSCKKLEQQCPLQMESKLSKIPPPWKSCGYDSLSVGQRSLTISNQVHIQLTPGHLRKAKLIFLFARYPNSNCLKPFFPDVMFSKTNTAQMVKWFSNFREYFYIQVERHVRSRLQDWKTSTENMESLWKEDESLHKAIVAHYNRSKKISVPQQFLNTISAAYKEFLLAVSSGRDRDPSWKKSIYKVIAKRDMPIPEEFKQIV